MRFSLFSRAVCCFSHCTFFSNVYPHAQTRAVLRGTFSPRCRCESFAAMSAPSLSTNTDIACSICTQVYLTANHALSLTCAEQGCRADLCYECLNRAVFNGTDEPKCPHCRRTVDGYGYAGFSCKRKMDEVQRHAEAADKSLRDEKHSNFEARARIETLQHDTKVLEIQIAERGRKIRRVEQLLRTAEENTLEAERSKKDAEARTQTLMTKIEEWETWAHNLERVSTAMPLRWAERGMEH